MKLLLDTHVLLWWLDGNRKLGARTRQTIESRDSAVWVSTATAWEIAIKMALGRLSMSEPPEVCLPRELDRSGFSVLPVTLVHALAVRTLPAHHGDPFDRMLVVQAKTEGVTLATADPVFERYGIDLLNATM